MVSCPILGFVDWTQKQKYTFPVEENDFNNKFIEYYVKNIGMQGEHKVGFINSKLVFLNVGVKYKGFRNMNSTEAQDFYERIEGMVNEFNG